MHDDIFNGMNGSKMRYLMPIWQYPEISILNFLFIENNILFTIIYTGKIASLTVSNKLIL